MSKPGIATQRWLATGWMALMVASRAAAAGHEGDELFADGAVTHLRIEVAAPAMEVLRGYAFRRDVRQEERPSVKCVVREGTNAWNNVALHLKGSLGSFRTVDDAPSFTLNFSKHISRQRFHGLEKISLNTSVQDPTRISEKLCRELYTKGGIPVPRAGYATAEWNGRRLGCYVMLEGWNRQFIERHFADGRGPLYEGPFLSDIDQKPIVAYGRIPGGNVSVERLLAAAREERSWKRWGRLDSVLDLDRFTRLLALEFLAWNGDGYALHANNYRIFHDRALDRLVFLPHGMDQMFILPDAPVLAGGDGLVASAVLSLPEGRQRVLARIGELRTTLFQPEMQRRRAMELGASVGLVLGRESGLTNAAPPAHTQAVLDFAQRITARVEAIDLQLAGLSNFIPLAVGESRVPTLWTNRSIAGAPVFEHLSAPPGLRILNSTASTGAWVTVQWLEQGIYRLQGNIRRSCAIGTTNALACGFRVLAPRKHSAGIDWGWDGRRRVPGPERFELFHEVMKAGAGTNWTEVSCEIDVRQPVAELEIHCEAAGMGEASFDLRSLRLTRWTDPGRN